MLFREQKYTSRAKTGTIQPVSIYRSMAETMGTSNLSCNDSILPKTGFRKEEQKKMVETSYWHDKM